MGALRGWVTNLRPVRRPRRTAAGRVAAENPSACRFPVGARQLAATRRPEILGSAAGAAAFTHHGLADGDEWTWRAHHAPGPHRGTPPSTFRSCCWTAARRWGRSTGGSLLVAPAARTDLAGPEPDRSRGRAVRLPAPARHPCRMPHRFVSDTTGGIVLLRPASRGAHHQPSGRRRPPTRCWQPR